MTDAAGSSHGASLCVGGVIVCGGLSRRMGQDKANIEFGGRSLLERTVEVLGPVCESLVLACGPQERYAELGLALALDESPDCGAVAGVIAGLEATSTSHALVVACDMPYLSRPVFEALLQRSAEDDLDVCFLAGEDGVEPLCAVYSRECLPALRWAVASGRRKVVAFLDWPGADDSARGRERGPLLVGRVTVQELSSAGATADCLVNLNTPEDLARAQLRNSGERSG